MRALSVGGRLAGESAEMGLPLRRRNADARKISMKIPSEIRAAEYGIISQAGGDSDQRLPSPASGPPAAMVETVEVDQHRTDRASAAVPVSEQDVGGLQVTVIESGVIKTREKLNKGLR